MARHVVVGKGPVGTATAQLLTEQGHDVLVLSRSGGRSAEGLEHRAVDAADVAALSAATDRADVVYNAVNPSYTRWAADWPPIATALLTAAERAGAVLVTTGTLYGYGRPDGVMTPHTPLAATDTKGRIRARMWADALAAHRAGRVRVTEVRASDFIGPTVPAAHSHLMRQLPTLRAGRRAWVIGDPDAPRTWTHLADVASTLVAVGSDARAWGRAWHVPSSPPRTQREALGDLARAMGRTPGPVSGVPWPVLRALGSVVPFARELVEVRHQWDAPFLMEWAETSETFGLTATPWADVVRASVGAPVPGTPAARA